MWRLDLRTGIRASPWLPLFWGHRACCQCWTLDTEHCLTVFPLSSYYPSQNSLYLQLQCSRRLQCAGFGVRMLRVFLNHPDFTSPAGASWKACQILGEHISSASYMVWHQMYSRTTVQAQTSLGSRTVRPLINILTASCWTTFSISSSLSTVASPSLSSSLWLFSFWQGIQWQ